VIYAILVLAILLVATLEYNRLARSRERTKEAWSGIEVQIQRRASLVPELVTTVKGYADHERALFEEVARARGALMAASQVDETAAANGDLTRGLNRVLAVAERYPELRAVESFLQLQAELADAEEKIAYARQFFNRNVLDYDTRLRRFPTVLIGRLFGFTPLPFFEIEAVGASQIAWPDRQVSAEPDQERSEDA
jgi:LemA protein